jgi:hypothetical protein
MTKMAMKGGKKTKMATKGGKKTKWQKGHYRSRIWSSKTTEVS